MLLKEQSQVSIQRGMPVNVVGSKSAYIQNETVKLYYFDSGTLTLDAGQAAGTLVIGKLSNGNVLNSFGFLAGSKSDTSVVFGGTPTLNNEVFIDWTNNESTDQSSLALKLEKATTGFANGDYCIDYRTGIIYGKKATTGVTLLASYLTNSEDKVSIVTGISAQPLTSAYAGGLSFTVDLTAYAGSFKKGTLLISYTTGAGETNNSIEVSLQEGPLTTELYNSTFSVVTGVQLVLSAAEMTYTGASAATAYTFATPSFDVNAPVVKFRFKETGVATNAGTLTAKLLLS